MRQRRCLPRVLPFVLERLSHSRCYLGVKYWQELGSPESSIKLKTTPTLNKNGSYGMKRGGSYAIFLGVRMPYFLSKSLDFNRLVYAIRTPIVWDIFGAYFLQTWGLVVVRIISEMSISRKNP